jgi:hypothetical protein
MPKGRWMRADQGANLQKKRKKFSIENRWLFVFLQERYAKYTEKALNCIAWKYNMPCK